MKASTWMFVALAVLIAVLGWNPVAARRETAGVLGDGYSGFETGVRRQPNGVYRVRALTRMPKVKAEMVRWWFGDYLQTTAHYKRWHPTAHVWMDWENKRPGEFVGASHLVHEYIGEELSKLRIQFVEPTEFLESWETRAGRIAVCARVGLLEEPMNIATMCHVVRDREWGAEMRSTFWLGDIAKRDGNETVFSLEGLVGNTALARWLAVNERLAVDLMTHAIEEMGFLADFLPSLYQAENSESEIAREGRVVSQWATHARGQAGRF